MCSTCLSGLPGLLQDALFLDNLMAHPQVTTDHQDIQNDSKFTYALLLVLQLL
jgi:hypothetical protein